jgi:hypothetical protein
MGQRGRSSYWRRRRMTSGRTSTARPCRTTSRRP